MRIDDALRVATTSEDYVFSPQEVIDVMIGAVITLDVDATYSTPSSSPTVYFTALDTDGSVITARTTSGVTLNGANLYVYNQVLNGLREFVAVWDEGDEADYVTEMIVI